MEDARRLTSHHRCFVRLTGDWRPRRDWNGAWRSSLRCDRARGPERSISRARTITEHGREVVASKFARVNLYWGLQRPGVRGLSAEHGRSALASCATDWCRPSQAVPFDSPSAGWFSQPPMALTCRQHAQQRSACATLNSSDTRAIRPRGQGSATPAASASVAAELHWSCWRPPSICPARALPCLGLRQTPRRLHRARGDSRRARGRS